MTKYYANMSANNGTHYRPDWEGANKNKLAKEIAASARANCFVGNECRWKVWDEDGIIVAAGAAIKKQNGKFSYLNCQDMIGELI